MIYTVRGPMAPKQAGRTLPHEHFKWEYNEQIGSTMYYDRNYDSAYTDELVKQLLPILKALYNSGCRTIVEASPPLGGQNLQLLYQLSCQTDMNIVPCTGLSISKYAYRLLPHRYQEQLAQRWIQDFSQGLDTISGTLVRPGYIKLLFDRGGISAADQASLRAAATASNATGLPIHCHVLEARYMARVMDILAEASVNPAKFIWAHADRDAHLETILAATRRGYWVGFDNIRAGTYREKKQLLEHAMENDYFHQVLLSQDYDMAEESERADGLDRYCAFFKEFIPYCAEQGIPQDILDALTINNPARFYDI